MEKYIPTGAKVLVSYKNDIKFEKNDSGLVVPTGVKDVGITKKVEVLAVGPGEYTREGKFIETKLKPGQVVIVRSEALFEIAKGVFIIHEPDVFAIVE